MRVGITPGDIKPRWHGWVFLVYLALLQVLLIGVVSKRVLEW